MKTTPTTASPMTDSQRDRVLRSLRAVHRAVLTFIDIDPKLAKPKYRPELTLLANMLSGEHEESEIGRAVTEIHNLHQRGFLVRACIDRKAPRVDVDTARAWVVQARPDLGGARGGEKETAFINSLLRTIGYAKEEITAGGAP
jgi:hypothetical protein